MVTTMAPTSTRIVALQITEGGDLIPAPTRPMMLDVTEGLTGADYPTGSVLVFGVPEDVPAEAVRRHIASLAIVPGPDTWHVDWELAAALDPGSLVRPRDISPWSKS